MSMVALERFNDGTDLFLAAFTNRLRDPNTEIRRAAVLGLARCRTNFPTVIAALRKALLDADQNVRSTATNALEELDQVQMRQAAAAAEAAEMR